MVEKCPAFSNAVSPLANLVLARAATVATQEGKTFLDKAANEIKQLYLTSIKGNKRGGTSIRRLDRLANRTVARVLADFHLLPPTSAAEISIAFREIFVIMEKAGVTIYRVDACHFFINVFHARLVFSFCPCFW
ncbi:hypothetical protein PFISCL1PPCAC_8522 [Pristionchus fissidentatus]|uniref:Ribosomal protein n=1 Tax=Pristionchus fissidentatus TaxID=1538716 RepID=A0AAV5VC06_9BILA|nr:hypothetical protein PFISCL1PPCAC_8522 [Pristionchus fissidentatus]